MKFGDPGVTQPPTWHPNCAPDDCERCRRLDVENARLRQVLDTLSQRISDLIEEMIQGKHITDATNDMVSALGNAYQQINALSRSDTQEGGNT